MKLHTFLDVLKVVAPIALAINPVTAPAAPFIGMAIHQAEVTFGPGAGPQKLEAARDLTSALISTHNRFNVEHQIDVPSVLDAFDGAVATTIDAVKVIQGVKQALPKKQNVDLPSNPAPSNPATV